MIRVSEALLYGTMILGQTLVLAPAFTKALLASQRVFAIIDRQNRIKPDSGSGESDPASNIRFADVDFRYPTRPNAQVLHSINLEVLEGKTVGLVGPSGCGKSTCLQLLQRFYEPERGQIFVGQNDISKDMSVAKLRSKISIVSQEPVLFDRTIYENIGYGGGERHFTIDDVMAASRLANIHDFIMALPMVSFILRLFICFHL